MPFCILHIADVHLDMSFAGAAPSFGAQRREQLREAFERALDLARARRVDAVCIAGDLYESDRSGPDRAAYLRRVLGELAPIRTFISPGNHDPYTASSLYRSLEPLPDHVTIFKRRSMMPVKLADNLTLWGCGHERPLDRDPILSGLSCDGPGTHLLLFHGSDRERMPPNKESIGPFTLDDIARSGATYAMVGHFHGLSQTTRYEYPGSLEPHTRAHDGRHTAALLTVEGGRVWPEFIDVNRTTYFDESFDLSAAADAADLEQRLRSKLSELVTEPGKQFCRLRLVGVARPTLDLAPPELEAKLAADFPGLELVEEFGRFDVDALESEGRTVRAEFVKRMRAKLAAALPEERALLERALEYGLLAFAGKGLHA